MFLILVLLACAVLYSTSKYVPQPLYRWRNKFSPHKRYARIAGCTLLALAAVLSFSKYGWGTGLVVYLVTLIFSLSLFIIVFPVNHKAGFILAFIGTLLIILKNI